LNRWLPGLVARVPASVHVKLLLAFLALVALLIVLGAVGLQALTEAGRRDHELLRLQRNIAVYRQLQQDATAQLYSESAALLDPQPQALDAALRQLEQFHDDVDRLQVAAIGDLDLLGQVQTDHRQFVEIVRQVVGRISQGQIDQGRLQLAQARPLAERIERRMNELVNRAEADMLQGIDDSQAAFRGSRWTVLTLSIGSIALALVLGYAISSSIVGPVQLIEARLQAIAAGDFGKRVEVPNRDELGALAADLNRMDEQLSRLYGQIEAANRHKSQFLANVSHELRTPLNAIIGFSDVLSERMFGELNPKQAEYVADILSSGRHLLALINDVLDLSKIEAGRMELEPSRFDLRAALESTMTLVRERATHKSLDLQLQIDANVSEVDADERKLKQVVLNLLSNAVKFTPPGGRITVRASMTDHALQIAVADSGPGIAVDDRALIFDEFRQAHSPADQAREGTGLGLALAKKFVEMHGGRIGVDSEPGAGATFTFTIPVQT
jgi:signal transduction histidine kinase